MRHHHFIAIVPGIFLLAIICIILLRSDAPNYRYSTLPCQYNMIFQRSGPVDIVVVGSSRSLRGVSPMILENAVPEMYASSVVINLARSWRGPGQIYRMLSDVFENHQVRHAVLFEVTHNENRQYYGYYKNYSVNSYLADIIQDFNSKPREPWLSRFRDSIDLFFERTDKSITQFLMGTYNLPPTNGDMPVSRTDGCSKKDNELNKARLRKHEMFIDSRFGDWDNVPGRQWSLDALNEDRQAYYLHKTIELCREYNVSLIFYYVPRYLEKPITDELGKTFLEKFGFTLVSPSQNIMEMMFDDGYTDPGHMGEKGRNIYTNWLVTEVRKLLDS